MNAPHINDLRQHLMATLASLRDRETPMEPDRARAIAQVASVLVDTARVEVEYAKATGEQLGSFMREPDDDVPVVAGPWPNVTRHRLAG